VSHAESLPIQSVPSAKGQLRIDSPTSIQDVVGRWSEFKCFQKADDIPDLGVGQGRYWIRLQVNSQSASPRAFILEHSWPSDYLRIFHVTPSGILVDASFGNEVYQMPTILHRYPAQRIVFQPGEQDIYVQLRHVGSVRMPLRLWSEESFQHSAYHEEIAAGILVGVTLAMMLYNMFLFITFRFKQQVYYVGFLIATFWYLLFFSGFSQNIPDPWRIIFSKTWIASSCLMCFFLCHFTLHFLELREKSLRTARILRFFAWFFSFTAALSLVDGKSGFILFSILAPPFMITCIWAGCQGVWRKGRPAVFYLLSFTFILMTGLLESLITQGSIDPKWTFWPFFAASNLQAILLSLAIGDKLHLNQKQAHRKIVDLNEELQQNVDHVNDLVDQKTREIRSIMTNLPQGILMIQKDLSIHKDHSSFCQQLFEQTELEGRNVLTVISQGLQIGADRLAQLEAALQACFDGPEIAFQLNQDCFPHECRRLNHKGVQQTLEMDWHPIVDPEGQIERILLSVRDVTSWRSLQRQSDEQMHRLELIGEVINVEPAGFLRLMKSCRAFHAENQRLILNLTDHDPEVNKILFINLHTMKGVARSQHLNKMSDLYHSIEQYLADLQMGQVDFSQDLMHKYMKDISDLLDVYESVSKKDLGRSMQVDEHAVVSMKDLEPFVQRIDRLDLANSRDTREFVHDVSMLFTQLYFQAPNKVFLDIFSSLTRLAKDLAKEVPQVNLELGDVLLTREAEDLFRNVFVHLLRNSMDHGIEGPGDRVKKGKASKGLISVRLRSTAEGLEVIYGDDGRGLDLQNIKAAAVRRGLLAPDAKPSLQELVKFIFTTGFTTSNAISVISGRGVGMDAVSRYVSDLGGTIQVEVTEGTDSNGLFVSFVFLIKLPSRFYSVSLLAA